MARTYHVPGISCGHCKSSIEAALSDVDGVSSVDVDIESRDVRVEGDVDEETVTATLDEIGYEVAPSQA